MAALHYLPINESMMHVSTCTVCAYALNLHPLGKEEDLCVGEPKESKLQAKLQPFFFLFFLPHHFFSSLPYFVILRSLPGGNFCAGYDLKMLANQKAPLKLEQDVTKGPGPMVSRARFLIACVY